MGILPTAAMKQNFQIAPCDYFHHEWWLHRSGTKFEGICYNRRKQEVELICVTQHYTKMVRMEDECRANNWRVWPQEEWAESPNMAKLWNLAHFLHAERPANSVSLPKFVRKVDVLDFKSGDFSQSSGMQHACGGILAGSCLLPHTE